MSTDSTEGFSAMTTNLPTLRQAQTVACVPEHGWLRAVRTTAGLSQGSVAERMSMTRQAYAGLEASEDRGAISIASLRRAAEAMDCELVYFIVPKGENREISGERARERVQDSETKAAAKHSTMLEEDAASSLPVELK